MAKVDQKSHHATIKQDHSLSERLQMAQVNQKDHHEAVKQNHSHTDYK